MTVLIGSVVADEGGDGVSQGRWLVNRYQGPAVWDLDAA
jgi:hypothetical protein